MLLAQLVVEFLANTSGLQAGSQAAARSQKAMQDAATSASSAMSAGLKTTSANTQELANKAKAAGLDVSRLATSENQAREAGAKLGVAQTQAAQALKKADDMARSGKSSAEQIAVAQSRAGLAAEKARTAENNLAASMQKVANESKNLSSALEPPAARSNLLSRGMDGLKSSVSGAANVAKTVAVAAFTGLVAVFVAVAAAIASTIPKAMAFDATLRKINALAGVSKEALAGASDEMLKMAGKVGKGPQDLAEGLYYVASAGFDAKTSMIILEASAKAAAVGMTSTQTVANAVTAALKAFPGMSVAQVMDTMTKTVSTGKTEWADYANVIGKVTLSASQAKVGFTEANAAFAVLTNVMPSSEQAATSLNALLATSSHFSDLADRAQKLGLAFDTNSYKSMSFIDRLRYLQSITKGNSEEIYNLLGQEEAMPAMTALLTDGAKDYATALDGISHSAGAADDAFKKTSAGAQAAWDRAKASAEALQIKIGTALLPVVQAFSDKIAPMVGHLMDWIDKNHILEGAMQGLGEMGSFLNTNVVPALSQIGQFASEVVNSPGFSTFTQSLSDLGTTITTVVVPAMKPLSDTLAGLFSNKSVTEGTQGLSTAFAQIGLAIFGVSNFIAGLPALFGQAQTAMAPLVSFLVETFAPVWDQLVTVWQTQLAPAWNELMTALTPLLPTFQAIGVTIGGVLVVALGLLVSILAGVVAGLAGFLGGMAQAFGGVVQIVSGVVQFIIGLFTFFVDLVTGKFDRLGNDWNAMWGGIVRIAQGAWNLFQGIIQAGVGFVTGLVGGFVGTIVKFFTGLYDKLVGHSIVVDLIAKIVQLFTDLPGKAATAAGAIIGKVGGIFTDLAGKALGWGKSILDNVAQGIKNGISGAIQAVQDFASKVASYLPHSPAREGPLRYLMEQGEEITNQVAMGMRAGIPEVESAVNDAARSISGLSSRAGVSIGVGGTPVRVSSARAGGPSDSKSERDLHLHLWMDSREIGYASAPHVSEWQKNELHVQAGVK